MRNVLIIAFYFFLIIFTATGNAEDVTWHDSGNGYYYTDMEDMGRSQEANMYFPKENALFQVTVVTDHDLIGQLIELKKNNTLQTYSRKALCKKVVTEKGIKQGVRYGHILYFYKVSDETEFFRDTIPGDLCNII